MAVEFFEKYYPEYEYRYFTCLSWLMDDTLDELLDKDSNILKFKSMFERFHKEKDDAILRYVFKSNTTRLNLNDVVASTSFAQKVKKWIRDGKDFYEVYGVLEKNKVELL